MTLRSTVAKLLANKSKIRLYGTGAAMLLGANLISGISLALISSGRLAFISSETANFIVIFIQWQVFALTVAKFGIDQVVFASVSADNTLIFDPIRHITRRVLPVSMIFAVIIGVLFSPWASLGLLFSLPLDTYSIMRIADLNARKLFSRAATAALFNYPVFVLLIMIVGLSVGLSAGWVILLFVTSSLTRTAYLWAISRRKEPEPMTHRRVDSQVSAPMMLQQAMNYWMFRSDVLLLSLAGSAGFSALEIQKYLFLSRFCDFVAVLVNSLGPVIYPLAFIRYPFGRDGARRRGQQAIWLAIACVVMFVFVIPPLFVYQKLWLSNDITPIQALPFLFEAALIPLPNLITYSKLRQGYLPSLLRNLAISLGIGLVCLAGISIFFSYNLFLLPFMIVFQISAFTILSMTSSWGKPKAMISLKNLVSSKKHSREVEILNR